MRTGLIAKKVGMSRLFAEDGTNTPITLLQVADCKVIGHKTEEKHHYTAVEIGFGDVKPQRLTKALLGVFSKRNIEPHRKIMEFRVDVANLLEIGSSLTPAHFEVGQFVDVMGKTIGKGFAGGMKRHNFGGLRASHGVSISHRSHGSTGNRQDPGKVFKGKKMAGHMGQTRVTIQNLKIVGVDLVKNTISVTGAVPGHEGGYVVIRDAVKKKKKKALGASS